MNINNLTAQFGSTSLPMSAAEKKKRAKKRAERTRNLKKLFGRGGVRKTQSSSQREAKRIASSLVEGNNAMGQSRNRRAPRSLYTPVGRSVTIRKKKNPKPKPKSKPKPKPRQSANGAGPSSVPTLSLLNMLQALPTKTNYMIEKGKINGILARQSNRALTPAEVHAVVSFPYNNQSTYYNIRKYRNVANKNRMAQKHRISEAWNAEKKK